MPDSQPAEVREIFLKVAEADPARRTPLLDEACGDRPDLRAQVEQLLAAHAAAGEFLADPTLDAPTLEGDWAGYAQHHASGPAAEAAAAAVPLQERPGT